MPVHTINCSIMDLNNDWQSDGFNYIYLFLNLCHKMQGFLVFSSASHMS